MIINHGDDYEISNSIYHVSQSMKYEMSLFLNAESLGINTYDEV